MISLSLPLSLSLSLSPKGVKNRASHQSAFTIVELLIVIVVIAILAIITVVAYNGIENRAKSSAVASLAAGVGKKVALYAVDNADTYPDEASYQSTLGLPISTATETYDYYVSADKKSYCASVTNTTTSPETAYATTNKSGVVTGRCVKNLVVNPSFVTGGSGWSVSSTGSPSVMYPTNGAPCNAMYRRATYSTATGNTWTAHYSSSTTLPVTAGESYTVASQQRRSVSGSGYVSFDWRMSNGTTLPSSGSAPFSLPSMAWTQLSNTVIAPANAAYVQVSAGYNNGAAAGETIDVACVMVVQSKNLYTYGDGDTPNWSWVGARGGSASFGPATLQ